MIADPEVNLLVAGPHPEDDKKEVFHWYEMCDAVQSESYKIDGVEVSNEKGARNDFLNRNHHGKTLKSFGVNPGGYIGFFDPATGAHVTFSADNKAEHRRIVKAKSRMARRGIRYQQPHLPDAGKRWTKKAKA